MTAKIFIADDERPVIEGVAAAIRKRLPDAAICGTAGTGRDAVDGAVRERPDVILMDVRMPGMNGLEALRELRSSAPETVPILLTAYERFDVAKEAFGLGVYDYLVKPVDQDLLVEAIRGALDAAAARKAEAARARNAIEALESRRPLLEEGLVYAALSGDAGGDRIRDYIAALGFGPDGGGFVAVRRAASDWRQASDRRPADDDERALRRSLGYLAACAVGAPACGALPVFYPESEAGSIEGALLAALQEPELRGLTAHIGPSRPSDRLAEAWREALAGLASAADGSVSRSRSGGGAGAPAPRSRTPLQAALEAASVGDAAAAAASWASLPDDRVLRAAAAGAIAWSLRHDPEAVVEAAAAVSDGAMPRAAFNPGKPGSGYGATGRVADALRCIEERYAEQISLEDVATQVGLSAAHLSRVLSNETGKSFIEHLSDIRIARAKAELASGRMSVKEVGAAVGYLDPNYFSRAFKRVTGATPSEYAKSAGRGDA
ncbi:MAG TPA: response regulator [Spirochaetia bacterium]|nr:response regulator [Spirochaetia bacterium]